MKKLIGLVGVIMLVGYVLASYVGAYNYGNRAENVIITEHRNMENILSQYSNQIMEMIQVPEAQKEDLKELIETEMSGRYQGGRGGAVMSWVQERATVDNTALYTNIQNAMVAGRNKFENAQTKFLDTKRSYQTELGYLVRGFWLGMAGRPSINLDDYDIVTSGYSNDAFATGEENGLKIRP
jgi:hypothetical protein